MSSNVPPLVGPVIALASWTFVMEFWLYTYRISDISTYNIKATPETTIHDLNSRIPRHRQWPSDNFAHLHEQPTVFYAVALSLTFLEANDTTTVGLAWAYVGARIVHSLIHATTNIISRRFAVFATSSVLLLSLTARAGLCCFF